MQHHYSVVDIVLHLDKQIICAVDKDHNTFTPLASWEEFDLNMGKYVSDYLNGEYEYRDLCFESIYAKYDI